MELTSLKADYSQLSANISRNSNSVATATGRLSSGERIVRAADDVSGMSIAARLLTRTTALRSSIQNLSQADSLLQVADKAMSEIEGALQRMNQLSVLANSGSISSAERGFLDLEFQQLKNEIDRIANTTQFNGVDLLTGSSEYDFSATGTRGITSAGNSLTNFVRGTENNDTLNGLGGQDFIRGEGGNDSLIGGGDLNVIFGGEGNDTVVSAIPEADGGSTAILPIVDNLTTQLDASRTNTITTHPGNVTLWQDQSGNANNGIPDTGAAQSGTGNINGLNSIEFDGNDILQIADSVGINLSPQNARSIMIAFETGADINTRQTLYEQGGQFNGFNIYIDGGNLYVGAWRDLGATYNFHFSTPIQANTVHTAGLVFDFGGDNTFRGYLDGAQFASTPVVTGQNAHSGDVGIGGHNNDTRFFDGGAGGAGTRFTGEIGEVLNYLDALTPTESLIVQDYLVSKWSGASPTDTVSGGAGFDQWEVLSGGLGITLDADSAVRELELFRLLNDSRHSITVKDGYFELGEGVQGDSLTIDASSNTNTLTVDADELSSLYSLLLLGGEGSDNFTGSSEGAQVVVSYAGARSGVEVNLSEGTATGAGDDTLNNIHALIGGDGHDEVTGSKVDDTVQGGAGDDIITDFTIETGQLITDGLVHYTDAFDFNSVNGHPGAITTINDKSGRGNIARDDQGVVFSGQDVMGSGNSLTFDGSSFLRINNTADINASGQAQRSIFTTFETSDDINTRQVIYEEGGSGAGYNIYIDDGRLYVGTWRGSGATYNLHLSVEIEENTTYSTGFIFDSTGGTFSGFLNGDRFAQTTATVAQQSHTGAIGIGGMHNNTRFYDGLNGTGDGNEFVGEIGELLIYNNALDSEQTDDLMNFLGARRLTDVGGRDSLSGGDGNDTITGGGSNDTIDGGSGEDVAIYSGNLRDYDIKQMDDGSFRVIDRRRLDRDGSDIVRNVETLRFADGEINTRTIFFDETKVLYQIDASSETLFELDLPDLRTDSLFTDTNINIRTIEATQAAFSQLERAINLVTQERARLGSKQSSIDILTSAKQSELQNQTAARGVIADTDIAATSSQYALDFAKFQASTTIAAQTNNLRSTVILDVLENAINVTPFDNG